MQGGSTSMLKDVPQLKDTSETGSTTFSSNLLPRVRPQQFVLKDITQIAGTATYHCKNLRCKYE
eukprot:2556144-Amphidinium_carterae.1